MVEYKKQKYLPVVSGMPDAEKNKSNNKSNKFLDDLEKFISRKSDDLGKDDYDFPAKVSPAEISNVLKCVHQKLETHNLIISNVSDILFGE